MHNFAHGRVQLNFVLRVQHLCRDLELLERMLNLAEVVGDVTRAEIYAKEIRCDYRRRVTLQHSLDRLQVRAPTEPVCQKNDILRVTFVLG